MSLNKIKNNKPPLLVGNTPLDKITNAYDAIRILWTKVYELEFELEKIKKQLSIKTYTE